MKKTNQSNRITIGALESAVTQLNLLADQPTHYRNEHPEAIPGAINVGHYYIDQAYGGYKLVQVVSSTGGIRDISHDGYGTKKQLWAFVQAYIDGLSL